MFDGFFRPKANFYRLPNDWFDIWSELRETTGRSRIFAPLKTTEYVIKWTWGYQNFDRAVRITRRDFQYGKRFGSTGQDRGLGLSSRSLESALDFLKTNRVIEEHGTGSEPTFLPCLHEEDQPGFLEEPEQLETGFSGFGDPQANYFKVPSIWTDLTCDVNSETLILSVEYFFRHTWGWQGGGDTPRWMDADDIAKGRRYRSPERQGERYDQGIGYAKRSVRDALNKAVDRGWLVWRPKRETRGREYALHLEGMEVTDDGRWIDPDPRPFPSMSSRHRPPGYPAPSPAPTMAAVEKPQDTESEDRPSPSSEADAKPEPEAIDDETQEENAQDELTLLRAQVAALTQMVQMLLGLLGESGIDVAGDEASTTLSEVSKALSEATSVPSTPQTEASKALTEASKALTEASKAPTEAGKAPLIQTPKDINPTPPPDTAAHALPQTDGPGGQDHQKAGGGGGDSHPSTTTTKALLERLTNLDPPMSTSQASKLIESYGPEPIQAWLKILECDPTVRSVAALLTYKLRNGEVPPGTSQNSRRAPDENCPQCRGTGQITLDVPETDPAHGKEYPCGCVFRG